jgi:HEAT repeat protein
MRAATVLTCVLTSIAFAPHAAVAQGSGGTTPHVLNGRLDTQAAGANFAATFQRLVAAQNEAAWIGYNVPTLTAAGGRLCCNGDTWISDGVIISNGRLATCGLEPGERATRTPPGQPATNQSPIRLEGPDTMIVLYRVEEKAVQKVRIFSPDCELDAGGRAIHWLEGVNPADSIKLLSSMVSGTDKVRSGAMSALAMHRDEVAVPALLSLARHDASTKVRGDALFWLAQTAGRKVAPEITAAIDNDPDTDVKKRAVFALSQLPRDEGVPLLIKVAKTNQNPAVRKQAMFWLGQSKDQRALDFFAEILAK